MNNTTNIKRQFFNSLKCGTGKAYLIAKNNATIDFSNYIIKGAIRNYAYDGQSEGSRAPYIFDLISTSDKKEKIRKAVLNGLATEQDDTWTLTHLFDLAKLYAQQNDKEARQAIYDRFLNNPIIGSDWAGYSVILELDGLEGLIMIAEKFGKNIDRNPDNWQDDSIIRHFQSDNSNINAIEKLEKLSETNKFIKLYLNSINQTKKNRKNYFPETPTFKDIIEEVLISKPFLSLKRRKNLTEIELNKIAVQLLSEKNKANIEKLLYVFTNHKFPFDSEFILKLAKQKATSKNRITEFAIDALKFLKNDNIRTFALERIPKTRNPAVFTDMLTPNYKSGDYKLLTYIATKFKNEHIIENLASSYSDIFSSNKTMECKEPLETLYNKMNCGIHRNGIIEILLDNNVLSEKIKEEIRYDSYLETRELFNKFTLSS